MEIKLKFERDKFYFGMDSESMLQFNFPMERLSTNLECT